MLARYEPDLRGAAEGPLNLDELLRLLGDSTADSKRERQAAIACYLSGGEGWPEAVRRLGGTFAADGTGLKERKSD